MGPTGTDSGAVAESAPLEYVAGYEGTWLDLESEEAPGLCAIELSCEEDIADEPKVDCSLRVRNADSWLEYDDIAGVELRGRSSYWAPKRQYSIELRTEEGEEQDVSLLGMPEESDWVLNGNYFDRSLFRNTLGYDLFRGMGYAEHWAPASAFCTFELNGTPLGIYSLVERVKRADGRVRLWEDDGSGSSFLLKLDDVDSIYSNRLGYGGWKPVYPKPENIDDVQLAGILDFLDGWYEALESEAPYAEDFGIWAYVDMDSWVDFVLLQELIRNNDAFYLSVHIWRDRGGRIHFVPWDLDLSLGQPSYNDNENPEGWIFYRPDWVRIMSADPVFIERLGERWESLRQGLLSTDALVARMERYVETLAAGIDQNFEIWPIESIQFSDDQLYEVASHEEEIERVRAFLEVRLSWMDGAIYEY